MSRDYKRLKPILRRSSSGILLLQRVPPSLLQEPLGEPRQSYPASHLEAPPGPPRATLAGEVTSEEGSGIPGSAGAGEKWKVARETTVWLVPQTGGISLVIPPEVLPEVLFIPRRTPAPPPPMTWLLPLNLQSHGNNELSLPLRQCLERLNTTTGRSKARGPRERAGIQGQSAGRARGQQV